MLNTKSTSRSNSNNTNQLRNKQKCPLSLSQNQYPPLNRTKKLHSTSFSKENQRTNLKSSTINKKSNLTLIEQKALKANREKREMKLKIINASIKSDLYKLQLDGQIARLDQMKLCTKEAIEKNKDSQAQAYAAKERVLIKKAETQQAMEVYLNMKHNFDVMIIHKEAAIKSEEAELASLQKKEEHINKVKYSIDSDISDLDKRISIAQKEYEKVYEELGRLKQKQEKNNKQRIEILNNIFVLKPWNKKVCILHRDDDDSDSDTNQIVTSVNRNRKSIVIKTYNSNSNSNQVMSYSFDYVISVIDQIYETQTSLSNEREYIWCEVFNIVNGYFNETPFLFVLLLTNNKPDQINRDIIDLCKKVVQASNATANANGKDNHNYHYISIKGVVDHTLVNISNDISNKVNFDQTANDININQGLVYYINSSTDQKPKIMIASFNIESEESISVLSIINEMNKKKKEKNKLKTLVYNHWLFNELNECIIPFHSLTVLDASVSTFTDDASIDFIMKLSQ